MKHRNVYIRKGGESMQWRNVGKAMYYLVAIVALVSALALFACGGDDDDVMTSDSNTQCQTIPLRRTGRENAATAGASPGSGSH